MSCAGGSDETKRAGEDEGMAPAAAVSARDDKRWKNRGRRREAMMGRSGEGGESGGEEHH